MGTSGVRDCTVAVDADVAGVADALELGAHLVERVGRVRISCHQKARLGWVCHFWGLISTVVGGVGDARGVEGRATSCLYHMGRSYMCYMGTPYMYYIGTSYMYYMGTSYICMVYI